MPRSAARPVLILLILLVATTWSCTSPPHPGVPPSSRYILTAGATVDAAAATVVGVSNSIGNRWSNATKLKSKFSYRFNKHSGLYNTASLGGLWFDQLTNTFYTTACDLFFDEKRRFLALRNGRLVDPDLVARQDTLHIEGIQSLKLTAEDIIRYFHEFHPVALEFVSPSSCNIRFSDTRACRRALRTRARPIPFHVEMVRKACSTAAQELNVKVIKKEDVALLAWHISQKGIPAGKHLYMRLATVGDRWTPKLPPWSILDPPVMEESKRLHLLSLAQPFGSTSLLNPEDDKGLHGYMDVEGDTSPAAAAILDRKRAYHQQSEQLGGLQQQNSKSSRFNLPSAAALQTDNSHPTSTPANGVVGNDAGGSSSFRDRALERRLRYPKERAGLYGFSARTEWICACGFRNFAVHKSCRRCHRPSNLDAVGDDDPKGKSFPLLPTEQLRRLKRQKQEAKDEGQHAPKPGEQLTPKMIKEGVLPVGEPIPRGNMGRKILERMGWQEGKGLGKNLDGIKDPVIMQQGHRGRTGMFFDSER
eukprot:jgi/Bigna1/125438/aug1.1_g146